MLTNIKWATTVKHLNGLQCAFPLVSHKKIKWNTLCKKNSIHFYWSFNGRVTPGNHHLKFPKNPNRKAALCSGLDCRAELAGHSPLPVRSVCPGPQRAKAALPATTPDFIALGEFLCGMARERDEEGKWFTNGWLWLVVCRSSLEFKRSHCRKNVFLLAPLYFFLCFIFTFLNLWQHRTDCDPLIISDGVSFLFHSLPPWTAPQGPVQVATEYSHPCVLSTKGLMGLQVAGWPMLHSLSRSPCTWVPFPVFYQRHLSTGIWCWSASLMVPGRGCPGREKPPRCHWGLVPSSLWAWEPGITQWDRNLLECLLSQVFEGKGMWRREKSAEGWSWCRVTVRLG